MIILTRSQSLGPPSPKRDSIEERSSIWGIPWEPGPGSSLRGQVAPIYRVDGGIINPFERYKLVYKHLIFVVISSVQGKTLDG